MGTQKKNVEMFDRINGWLHSIGPDGRYNRDRLYASLGIAAMMITAATSA